MKHLITILILFLSIAAHAADPAKLPADAETLVNREGMDEFKLKADFDAKVYKLRGDLVAKLTKAQEAATKKGDLDGALALKAKIADLSKDMPEVPAAPISGRVGMVSYEKVSKDLTSLGKWQGPNSATTDGSLQTEWCFAGGNVSPTWTAEEPVTATQITFIGRWKWDGDTVSTGEIRINGQSVGKFKEWLNKSAITVTLDKPTSIKDIQLVVGPAQNNPSVSEMIVK